MDAWKRRWGAGQWAAFFEHQALPVLGRSKILLAGLEEAQGDLLSPKDLSDIVLQDPMLCLCLLREAERRKSRRLGSEVAGVSVWTVGVFASCFISISGGNLKSNKNGAGFRTEIDRESDAVVLLVEPPLAQRSTIN